MTADTPTLTPDELANEIEKQTINRAGWGLDVQLGRHNWDVVVQALRTPRPEAAEWNDAIEAAAKVCETAPDLLQNSTFSGAAAAIRALKRHVPQSSDS